MLPLARAFFANTIEAVFEEAGFSLEAGAGGPQNTILAVFMPGTNKATADQFWREAAIFRQAKEYGFKKVIIHACKPDWVSSPHDRWEYTFLE